MRGDLGTGTTVRGPLPTPTYGWNLGNDLEAIPNEGAWGPAATQTLINNVAAAGFNVIRIPCAWDTHADQSTLQIDPTYMARVKQVVDWCYAKNLYVIVNCHWDGGWLDNNIGDTPTASVTQRMHSYWTQIATTFAGYDDHLVFAGANEPPVNTAAQMSTLISYYQTFVNAVRAAGGNNSTRWLVVQGPNTNIDKTYNMMNTLPSDPANHLMVEVHHYPYQWSIMTSDASWGNMFYFWGQSYHSPTLTSRNSTWGEESYTDSQFQEMATKFVSNGIPVIIGEFGAVKRTGYADLTGTELQRHLASRTYYDKTIVDKANALGIKPIYWDAGGTGSNTMWLFDRSNAAAPLIDPDSARALTGGAALPPPAPPTITGQPQSVTITSGDSFSLSVTASGPGTLSYQWYLGATAISGATGATYSVAWASSSDAGSYTVVVSNADGSATSSAATVTVNQPASTGSAGSGSSGGGGGGATSEWFLAALGGLFLGRMISSRRVGQCRLTTYRPDSSRCPCASLS